MDTTKPSANFQPQIVQYTPIDRSIEKSVLALVSPSNNSLALVSTKTRANLNFASSTPIAPSPPAAPLPKREPCLPAAGCRSSARLNSATRVATVRCCVVSGGRRSSACRHAASSALVSPVRFAWSASAARCFSSSTWTSRWQDGQASSAGATWAPHSGQTGGANPANGVSLIPESLGGSGRRGADLVGARDPQRNRFVQPPRLIQSNADNEQSDDVADPREDRQGGRQYEKLRHPRALHPRRPAWPARARNCRRSPAVRSDPVP